MSAFDEPYDGLIVRDPAATGERIVRVYGDSPVNLYNRKGRFLIHLTRAEFAARAKPPFNWTVITRAGSQQ